MATSYQADFQNPTVWLVCDAADGKTSAAECRSPAGRLHKAATIWNGGYPLIAPVAAGYAQRLIEHQFAIAPDDELAAREGAGKMLLPESLDDLGQSWDIHVHRFRVGNMLMWELRHFESLRVRPTFHASTDRCAWSQVLAGGLQFGLVFLHASEKCVACSRAGLFQLHHRCFALLAGPFEFGIESVRLLPASGAQPLLDTLLSAGYLGLRTGGGGCPYFLSAALIGGLYRPGRGFIVLCAAGR